MLHHNSHYVRNSHYSSAGADTKTSSGEWQWDQEQSSSVPNLAYRCKYKLSFTLFSPELSECLTKASFTNIPSPLGFSHNFQLTPLQICRARMYEPELWYAVYSSGPSLIMNVGSNIDCCFLLHLTLLGWSSGHENWMRPTVLKNVVPAQLTFLTGTRVSFIL